MLSLCMIVKNEAENLNKYFLQIKDLFDELIIVDTGSTDNTIEIAKKITNKSFSIDWNDNFSEAKNYAIGKAQGEWILFLDADELITKEDIEKIKEAIKTDEVDAFRLNVINYLNQKTTGAIINRTLPFNHPFFIQFKLARLFRNKEEYKYKYRIHELIEDSIEENKGTIKELDVYIHHFGTLNIKSNKESYYEKLVLDQLEELPNDKRALYYAGKFFLGQKKFDESIALFEKITKIDPVYKNIHAKIGQAYFAKNNLTKAIEHYKKSLELVSDNDQKAQLVNQLAFLFHKNKQNYLAKHLLETFLKQEDLNVTARKLLEFNLKNLTEHLNKTPNNH